MSNVLAIAATTRTLRNLLLARMPLLDGDLSDLEVTLQPPDVARKGISKAQLNVFLYQVVYNAAWRNQDMPGRVRPGESATPALALNLHYLITAWGRGESDSDAISHRVLAAARSEGERMWPLPAEDDYKDYLKSAFADLANVGGRYGGASTAAVFLKEFAEGTPWVHLDIAGPAFLESSKGWLDAGGTGYGVRTLVELARRMSGS